MDGPATAQIANRYRWGDGCLGWRLIPAGAVDLREEEMPPGAAEVPHVHAQADQVFYVLDGVMTVTTPDGTAAVAAGSAIRLPPRMPHRVVNESARPLRFLLFSSPSAEGDRRSWEPADAAF